MVCGIKIVKKADTSPGSRYLIVPIHLICDHLTAFQSPGHIVKMTDSPRWEEPESLYPADSHNDGSSIVPISTFEASSQPRGRIAVSVAAAIAIAASSAWVLKTILDCADVPFTWDGAGHVWEGLIIARRSARGVSTTGV